MANPKQSIKGKLQEDLHISVEGEAELLEQEYITYRTIYQEMKARSSGEAAEESSLAVIDELLEQDRSWSNVSSIQQCMVQLMTEEEIDIDLNIRLIKANGLLSRELLSFYHRHKNDANVNRRKELLERLIRDLQWYGRIMDIEKTYVSKTRLRTGILFSFSILMFFAVDQMPWIADFLNIEKGDKGDAIMTAITAGIMGTCFSMLTSLKTRLSLSSISDLKIIHRLDYIASRALIGLVSGLILFYFFDSEIITAPLFPEFYRDGLPTEYIDDHTMALLVIWCFISGFSEKFVPDLLFKTGKKLASEIPDSEEPIGKAAS